METKDYPAYLKTQSDEAYVYYTRYDCLGNNFGWHLKVPYIIGMIILAKSAVKRITTPA